MTVWFGSRAPPSSAGPERLLVTLKAFPSIDLFVFVQFPQYGANSPVPGGPTNFVGRCGLGINDRATRDKGGSSIQDVTTSVATALISAVPGFSRRSACNAKFWPTPSPLNRTSLKLWPGIATAPSLLVKAAATFPLLK